MGHRVFPANANLLIQLRRDFVSEGRKSQQSFSDYATDRIVERRALRSIRGLYNRIAPCDFHLMMQDRTDITHSPKRTVIEWLTIILMQGYPRLLGLIFIYAAWAKSRNHDDMLTVMEFDRLPEAMVEPTAWGLIAVEAALGLMLLIFVWFRKPLLLTAVALLGVYTVQLIILTVVPDAPSCGCMGLGSKNDLLGSVRNICLILPALWTWIQLSPPPQSDKMATQA
jgi:uncharacterized membrane protein YphA (DoxX/SURF4 family)